MKRTKILLMALLLNIGMATADEVTVNNVTIPKGGQAKVSICLTNPNHTYTAGQMALSLPEGVTALLKNNGDPTVENGDRMASTNHSIGASHLSNGTEQFTIFSISSEAIAGTEGILFSVFITADENLVIGTTLDGVLKDIEMTTTNGVRTLFNDQHFTIIIGEPADTRTVLDETSTTVPASATNVDVRVRRKIKADEWSTLCLPFAMDETQVKAAFGDDVQLAEFGGWAVTEWNANDEATAIQVTFNNVSAITANTPCVIKVSQAMSEFTVDGVDIDVDDEPCVTVGKMGKGTFGSFTGSYVPVTIDDECLFLSDNKFWYSVGNTNMKGFRCYFYFQEVLASFSSGSGAKIGFTVDETNVIYNLTIDNLQFNADAWYTLEGVKLNKKPTKAGVYLHGGKKVVVK